MTDGKVNTGAVINGVCVDVCGKRPFNNAYTRNADGEGAAASQQPGGTERENKQGASTDLSTLTHQHDLTHYNSGHIHEKDKVTGTRTTGCGDGEHTDTGPPAKRARLDGAPQRTASNESRQWAAFTFIPIESTAATGQVHGSASACYFTAS